MTGSVVFALGLAPVYTLAADMMVGSAPPGEPARPRGDARDSSEFGGALARIAVLGAIGTAVYRGEIDSAVPTGIPPQAAEAARDTLGAAVAAGDALPGQLAPEGS